MEENLKFYDVDIEYVKYLKKFDNKVPNIEYANNNKFVCGIVLNINDNKFFAPISSKINKTNPSTFIILENNKKPISSIRFSYMFPIPSIALTLKDFERTRP